MGRRRYQFDAAKVQRYLQEGRGSGQFNEYRPWLKIQDVPSKGRSHRVWGIKTGRVHHFLSDGEWKCFLMFESDARVLDIREQFPLDTVQTLRAAKALGYKHPYNSDGSLYVMTIDFLVTYQGKDGPYCRPFTFKYSPEELSGRQIELIEIAQEFWTEKGHELQVLSEKFFDAQRIKNYDAVRGFFNISAQSGYNPVLVGTVAEQLNQILSREDGHSITVADACQHISMGQMFSALQVMNIFKHLLCTGYLHTDYSHPMPLEKFPLGLITVNGVNK